MTEKKIDNDLNDFLNEDYNNLDESFYDVGDSDNSFYQDHPEDKTNVTIPVVTILSKSDDSYKNWIKDQNTKDLMKKVFKEDDTILALKIKSNGDDSIDSNIKKIFALSQKMSLIHENQEKEEVFYMNLNDKDITNLEITFIDGQRTVYMDKVRDDDTDIVKTIKQSFNSFIVSDYKTYPTNVGNFIDNLLSHYGLNVDKSLLFQTIKDSKNATKMGKDGKPLLNYFGKYRSIALLSFEYNKVRITIPVLFMLRTASYLHTQNKYFNGKSLTSSYDKVKNSIKAKNLFNIEGMEDEDTKNIYKKSETKESSKVPVIKAESRTKDIAIKDFVISIFKSVSLLYKMSNKEFNPSEIDNQIYKNNLSYILFGKVKCKYENNMFLDGNNKADFLKITNQTPSLSIKNSNIIEVSTVEETKDFDMDDL